MKYTDRLLITLAGFSLYSVVVLFSTTYFVDFNHLIPGTFSDRVSLTISQTFHQILASSITALLLVRFSDKAILMALFIAIAVNIESNWILMTKFSISSSFNYYLSNPVELINPLKPILLLTGITYLISLFVESQRHIEILSD